MIATEAAIRSLAMHLYDLEDPPRSWGMADPETRAAWLRRARAAIEWMGRQPAGEM